MQKWSDKEFVDFMINLNQKYIYISTNIFLTIIYPLAVYAKGRSRKSIISDTEAAFLLGDIPLFPAWIEKPSCLC